MLDAKLSHETNRAVQNTAAYPESFNRLFDREAAMAAWNDISSWPDYTPTPLLEMSQLAAEAGLDRIAG